MTDNISKLEKLAELKAAGVLTDKKFASEKASLLGAAATAPTAAQTPRQPAPLSAKWKKRFDFFATYGSPWSAEARTQLREMRFFDRMLIEVNLFALVFGIFYFLFLGLWRRATTLFAIITGTIIVLDGLGYSGQYERYLTLFIAGVCLSTANYAYYRKKTTGQDSWNPFDFWSPAHADLGLSRT